MLKSKFALRVLSCPDGRDGGMVAWRLGMQTGGTLDDLAALHKSNGTLEAVKLRSSLMRSKYLPGTYRHGGLGGVNVVAAIPAHATDDGNDES